MGVVAEITNGLSVGAYVLAFVTVGAVLFGIRLAIKAKNPESIGLGGLFIGYDGRTSTSKVTAFAWTLALIYAYAAQLWAGRLEIGTLQEEYLFLLGGPYAALVAAKAITTSKVGSGTITKEPAEEELDSRGEKKSAPKRALDRASEIISNDAGELELSDFQYFAFNLLALVYFFVAFVSDPSGAVGLDGEAAGLPDIPETLVGLSTAAAAGYLGRKGVEKGEGTFQVISVVPTKVVLGETVRLIVAGADFIGETVTNPIDGKPQNAVMLDGIAINSSDGWTDEVVTATLDGYAEAGIRANPRADLVVRNHAGRVSDPVKVQIVDAPPN